MRGTTIQKILSNLGQKEFAEFVVFTKKGGANSNEISLIRILQKEPYSEQVALKALGVSKRKKNSFLQKIGKDICFFFGNNSQLSQMESCYDVAKFLANSVEYEAAVLLIKPLLFAAVKQERHDFVIRCLGLLKPFHVDQEFDSVSIGEASLHLALNAQLVSLLDQVEKARSIDSFDERKKSLLRFRNQSFDIFENNAIGQRGQLTFLKIQFRIDLMSQDVDSWPRSQAAVVAQIEAYPWVCEHWEYEYAHELRILSQSYWQANLFQEFRLSCAKFWTASFKSKQAQLEQAIHQFPFLFGIAIDSGDEFKGNEALQKFELLIKKNLFQSTPRILSLNYYFITYYLIASNQPVEARKYLRKLLRFPNQHVSSNHLFMVNILSAVLMLQAKEIVDAQRILKNLRNSKGLNLIPGASKAIEFLKVCSNSIDTIRDSHLSMLDDKAIRPLLSDLVGKEVLKYFNLEVWFYAIVEKRPMLEIFKDRANSEGVFSF